jgi:hypothetical protein
VAAGTRAGDRLTATSRSTAAEGEVRPQAISCTQAHGREHPSTGELMTFDSPLPRELTDALRRMGIEVPA